jgi:hypothetical protein
MVTIFTSSFFVEYILPFILVFTVVFAILQKSGILGKDKKQIDALVGLVVALITISFANAVGIINSLLPFMSVAIVIILIFLILVALFHKSGEFELTDPVKKAMMGLVGLAVVIAVLVATGAWDYILGRWFIGSGEGGLANFIFIIIIIIAVAFLAWPKKKDS